MELEQRKQLIKSARGKFFSCEFIKQNGEYRRAVCKLKVKRAFKGGTLKYDPDEKNLVPVYDIINDKWISIKLNRLVHLGINGKEYQF